jgi:hypothetical protein
MDRLFKKDKKACGNDLNLHVSDYDVYCIKMLE